MKNRLFIRQQIVEHRDSVLGGRQVPIRVFFSGEPDLGTGLRFHDECFQVRGNRQLKDLVFVQIEDLGNRAVILSLDLDFVVAGFQIRYYKLTFLIG